MAAPPLDKKKSTQAHILALTDEWANFVDATVAEATAVVGRHQRQTVPQSVPSSLTQTPPGGNPP